MSGFSDEYKLKILDHVLGTGELPTLAEGFLALTTVAVVGGDKGNTITEPGWTGYGRQPMKASEWAAAAAGKKANNTVKTFAECTAGAGTVIGWAYCTTEETGSGLVVVSGVVPPTVVSAGITPQFLAGALVFKISDT